MTRQMFATPLYDARIDDAGLLAELAHSIRALAEDDEAGQRWCREHRYRGYTSYASLDDLVRRDPVINELANQLKKHAAAFARSLAWGEKPRLDSLWVNMLRGEGHHAGHIHPHSILSGTFYVEVPKGSGAIRFEDPRLPMMMAAPVRTSDAPAELQPFVTVEPEAGQLLMWESWLRHEVLGGTGRGERLSISFNFA